MYMSNKARAIGITAGVAIFVAVALFTMVSSNKPVSEKRSEPTAITESLVIPAEQLGKVFATVAAHVKPAVVSVYSEKMVRVQPQEFPFPFGDDFFGQFFGQPSPQQPKSRSQPKEYRIPQRGMGSGMILDKQGHILTNYHVVSDVNKIKIQLSDKRIFEAEIVGKDPKTDIAVIKITGNVPNNLPSVQLGDSDALEDGHLVIAVGAPFGLTQTVTSGIISAKGRSDVGIAAYEDFLQTDASINPGNSGGPLVNMRGEVIGMNSAIATGGMQFGGEGQFSGVGFAIPANMIKTVLPTLIKGEEVTRGMMGVVIQELNADLAKHFGLSDSKGALVAQVNKDSPAEKAGLKTGDVIVRFEGKEVRDTRQLRNLVAAATPGTSVKVDVIRDGKEQSFTVTIGRMPTEMVAATKPSGKGENRLDELGLSVQTLTPDLARQLDLQGEKGVLISGIEQDSIVSMANLQVGDLIVEVNRQRVTSVAEFLDALGDQDQILLLIRRNGESLFVMLRMR